MNSMNSHTRVLGWQLTIFFLSDPLRPVGGIEDTDGVDDARPSVLYVPAGP